MSNNLEIRAMPNDGPYVGKCNMPLLPTPQLLTDRRIAEYRFASINEHLFLYVYGYVRI